MKEEKEKKRKRKSRKWETRHQGDLSIRQSLGLAGSSKKTHVGIGVEEISRPGSVHSGRRVKEDPPCHRFPTSETSRDQLKGPSKGDMCSTYHGIVDYYLGGKEDMFKLAPEDLPEHDNFYPASGTACSWFHSRNSNCMKKVAA